MSDGDGGDKIRNYFYFLKGTEEEPTSRCAEAAHHLLFVLGIQSAIYVSVSEAENHR